MKKFITAILLLCLVFFCVGETSASDSIVRFEGGAENFIFLPEETDLFINLKDAMPGDELAQTINVSNNSTEYDSVRLFLRIETHDDENNPLSPEVAETETLVSMQDFLAQLRMRIFNGGDLIYDNSASEPGELTENVMLGEFKNGDESELKVEIIVPASLDNEYMHRKGEIDFVFTAEEVGEEEQPQEGETPAAANTGQNTKISGGLVAGGIIGTAIITVMLGYVFYRKIK